ncbi:MAG: hypothetical protein M3P34_06345 [Actinomycetota bacterium]|nr:hypothetical protein [Actinomycetota bacterium]
MPNNDKTLLRTDTDLASRRSTTGARHQARPGGQQDDDLVAWLVNIAATGASRRHSQSELAEWLMVAVPRRHWAAVGHLWCTMNGLTATRTEVIRLAGPLTLEQARHVLWAVRRRARGVVRDELAAQLARRRREIPVGDLRGDAVA